MPMDSLSFKKKQPRIFEIWEAIKRECIPNFLFQVQEFFKYFDLTFSTDRIINEYNLEIISILTLNYIWDDIVIILLYCTFNLFDLSRSVGTAWLYNRNQNSNGKS